jgi:signal recognition particle subunit SRP54
VIYDTAGRLQIDETLMQELEQAKRAVNPDEIFFVADAMIGQEAVNVAEDFFKRLNFTGVCLSKMDGDTRGGAALSIRKITGVPVCFAGTGEKVSDIDIFHPDRMAGRILGMGDVVSLVEKAQAAIDEKEANDFRKKILNNSFDLNDFLKQLRMIKKIGKFKDIMSLIPGLNKLPLDQINEKELVYVEAVLSSMTEKERKSPSIINGSRRIRIAKGSGTNAQKVNQVLKHYEDMKSMFKNMGSLFKKMGWSAHVGSNYTPPKVKKKKKKR